MTHSISIRTGLALTVFLAVLTAAGPPAQAGNVAITASDDVVGSQHTTAEDFNNAQKATNLSISGTGESAVLSLATDGLTETFEDGDLSEYSGDKGAFSLTTTNAHQGSYSLNTSAGSSNSIIANTSRTIEAGTNISYTDVIPSGSHVSGVAFGLQNAQGWSGNAGYYVTLSASQDQVTIWRIGTGGSFTELKSTSVSVPAGEQLGVDVEWAADGQITVTVTDSTGAQIASTSTTDTTYSSGYMGWFGHSTHYIDDLTVGGGGAAQTATYISPPHNVSNPETAAINITQAANVSITVTVRTESGVVLNQTTVTTTGNHTLNLAATSSSQLETVLDVDVTGSSPQFDLADESILFDNHAPNASSASPNGLSTNNEQVTLSAQVNDTEFGTAQGDTVTVDVVLDGSVVHSTTISSNQTVSTTVNGLSDGTHNWHLELKDSYGATTTTSSWSFEVKHYTPTIHESTASPVNETVNTSQVELSIDVSDRDFSEPSGDTVNVSFYVDGEYRGSDVGSANGTYSVTIQNIDGGDHNWSVTATSETPGTGTSSTQFPFSYPDELVIRNETGNHSILTNLSTEIEVTFYTNNTVITRQADNGTVPMTGLPVDDEFVVTIEADGWYSRRVIIDSLTQQKTIYLLNDNKTAVYNAFELRDFTGNYPAKSTRLYIQKGMNVSGDSGYYTIAGDYFGATGEFPAYLHKGARYKLVLETKSGRKTEVGAYLASRNGSQTIRVGTVEFNYPEGDSFRTKAVQNGSTLIWKYSDPNEKTKDLKLVIHQRGNSSNVIYRDSVNELGNYTLSLDLAAIDQKNATEKQWVISWNATRAGEKIGATSPYAPIKKYPIPLGQIWKAGLSFVLVCFVAALGGGQYSPEGGIATVAIAGILMGFGFADIYQGAWWIALVIGIGGYLHDRGVPI